MNRKGRNALKMKFRQSLRKRLVSMIMITSKSHAAVCVCHGLLPSRDIKENKKLIAEFFGESFPAIALAVSRRRRLPGFPIRRPHRKTAK